jgi:hypothetical protein
MNPIIVIEIKHLDIFKKAITIIMHKKDLICEESDE